MRWQESEARLVALDHHIRDFLDRPPVVEDGEEEPPGGRVDGGVDAQSRGHAGGPLPIGDESGRCRAARGHRGEDGAEQLRDFGGAHGFGDCARQYRMSPITTSSPPTITSAQAPMRSRS